MDEQILREISSVLQEIKAKLDVSRVSALRGPVADPGPEWFFRGPVADPAPDWYFRRPLAEMSSALLRGPVADPAPEYLLDKAKLAQIKIHKLDSLITQLKKQIDMLKLEQDLLKEEYGIKK